MRYRRERKREKKREKEREKRERGKEREVSVYRGRFIYILLEVTFFSPLILSLTTLIIIIIQRYFVNNNFGSPSLL